MPVPPSDDLRIAVVGAGLMGADHVERLTKRTAGATVSAVVDVDTDRAAAAAKVTGHARIFSDLDAMISAGAADAVVLATPGSLHEKALLSLVDAGLPVLCEKPLTPDPESALRVVEAEVAAGRRLIRVGFMRRHDAGYQRIRRIIDSGEYGDLLMLHHQHRNERTPDTFTDAMLIHDSVVHEFDAVRFFTGEEIANVQVRRGKRSRHSTELVRDPQQVTIQTESGLLADVEIFVNSQLGYQVLTQAVFERGVVKIGEQHDLQVTTERRTENTIDATFHTRFRAAFDAEFQEWVDSVRAGTPRGPSAWDGYATAAVCDAGVTSQSDGTIADVELASRPNLYT